jgi:hypothetical protein
MMANATDIDQEISKHVDSCPSCVKGEPCNLRDALYLNRAERRHGNVVAKTDHIKAVVQNYTSGGSSLTLFIDGQFAGGLSQEDGLELEKGLNLWLHSDD